MKKSIALFGGSFNPPHLGHQMMVSHLAWSYHFDQIWINPVYHHPFNKESTLIPFQHRLAMAQLAFEKIAPGVKVTTIDQQYQIIRTFDLLTTLIADHPNLQFTLILGEDQHPVRHKWYRFSEIEKMVDIIYLGRTGVISELDLPFKFPDISSTTIRENPGKNQRMLDCAVFNYMKQHQLYGFHDTAE